MSTGAGARATPEQMQHKHIFVVNGSADFLEVLRELLQDEDYNVTTTSFVPRTFKQIESARPSLPIVDLIHGEKADWELLAEPRQKAARRIPVILVSTSRQLLERAEEEEVIRVAIATCSSHSNSMRWSTPSRGRSARRERDRPKKEDIGEVEIFGENTRLTPTPGVRRMPRQ